MVNDLPIPEYGHGMIEKLDSGELGNFIIVTQEIPWNLFGNRFREKALKIIKVKETGQSLLNRISDQSVDYDTMVALGGGIAIDSAKFVAWKNRKRLLTIPTVISADVSVCRAIAVRENWKVRYIGDKMPERLIIDFGIIQSAPAYINRGGICDILSCYTALQDWEISHVDTGETKDQYTIEQTQSLLRRLFSQQKEIHDVTEDGIRFLMEGYLEEVRLCENFGSPRPEEGSEHFFCL
jgi:glycerol-1-phosphate dehydrogenase [NAD(P)+]